ncbi:hypothetical protein GCM10007860_22180 [Chitiniphilus shinanonensis]|uniref:Stress-response A/B barrel domain-containing protein n=1 Tax=Chitiniphilus shinanonensis TaxID=553088 RepID=A0ABQ6BTQ9_9NEIS|nr:Dabb family protein [Chitiniphilus shinanonensis]GLS05068.1 hypothetical protein GCM10007860_22180 [Chitiniphilus shinanonensis]
MILHMVLFKFKSGFSWQSPIALDAEAKSKGHPAHIKEILAWLTGRDISRREVAADFTIAGLFKDQAALQSYLVDADHMEGVVLWREIATWQVIDIDLDARTTTHLGIHELLSVGD